MGSLFEKLFGFLKDLVEWFFDLLYYCLVWFVNNLIASLGTIFEWVIDLLPNGCGLSGFTIPPGLQTAAQNVAWFFPLGVLIQCMTVFCCALLAYIMVKPIMKFIRVA